MLSVFSPQLITVSSMKGEHAADETDPAEVLAYRGSCIQFIKEAYRNDVIEAWRVRQWAMGHVWNVI